MEKNNHLNEEEFGIMVKSLTEKLINELIQISQIPEEKVCSLYLYNVILASISSLIVFFLQLASTSYEQKWADLKRIIISVESTLSEIQKREKQH